METFKIKIPATSANLGLGFDSMGVAVDLFLTIEAKEASQWSFHYASKDLEMLPKNEDNLVCQTAKYVAEKYGLELPGIEVWMDSEIPLTHGLGSSSSAIVAGIEIADHFLDLGLSEFDKVLIGTELEGHPDNIGPCITGGAFIGYYSEELAYYTTRLDGISLITTIPEYEIGKIKNKEKVIVIPGFFGYTPEGEIVTFSRGGSDIIGAIVARGVEAEQYDNFTDQSYIYSAHPSIVESPHPIKELTYREMRELSYSGFGIFHDEALRPLYEAKIPIMVRHTNYPEIEGTKIVSERFDTEDYPVIGVSGSDGFFSITIKRYLLNREVGFARRFLQVFERYGISIEHFPTGIDDLSVIMVKEQFEGNNKLEAILEDIEKEFDPEWVHVEEELAVIAIVGEGMRDTIGIANTATQSFTDAGISMNMINQGASEISMFFAIKSASLDKALQYLYRGFFDGKE